MCLAQGPQRSDAVEARTRGPRSRVSHSTTEPLRSLNSVLLIISAQTWIVGSLSLEPSR